MSKNEISSNVLHSSQVSERSLVCSFGGITRKLPHSMVALIEPIGQIARVPFSNLPFEGLINSEHTLSPLFDFSHFLGGQAHSGKYCLLVKSKKGLIRLRTDEIISLDSSISLDENNAPSAADEIEAMLKDFSDSSKNATSIEGRTQLRPVSSRSVLIIEVATRLFAFDNHGVCFIEHHRSSNSITPKESLQRIVTLQNNALVSGISLGKWLESDGCDTEDELWSIGYNKCDAINVITVPKILGVESIDISHFYKIRTPISEDIWINHPKYGAIQFLDIGNFDPKHANPITRDIETLLGNQPSKSTIEKTSDIKNGKSGLGLHFKEFSLVLPIDLVKAIDKKISNTSAIKKPLKRGLPAFDLSKIPGFEISQQDHGERHSITLRGPEQKNIAFLAPEIYKLADENNWQPIPILPKSLSRLISAVRVQNNHCEFLMNSQVITNSPSAFIKKLADKAFCGWISRPKTQ